jgi:hypothetical protein
MEHAIRDYLLAIMRSYAKAKNLALATVARRFHGKDSFAEQFAAGECSVTLHKAQEMESKFKAEWPDEVRFPKSPIR